MPMYIQKKLKPLKICNSERLQALLNVAHKKLLLAGTHHGFSKGLQEFMKKGIKTKKYILQIMSL